MITILGEKEGREVVERSRLMPDNEVLVPPAKFPALFTCLYHGKKATGCVYPVGCVCVVPDDFGYPNTSTCLWLNVRGLESDERVTDICWSTEAAPAFTR